MKKFPHFKTLLFILLISLIGNGLLLYIYSSHTKKNHLEISGDYPLVSKRVFVPDQNDILINFIPLRKAIQEYLKDSEGKVGVYFEYLPSGTSININATEEIRLASLAKVPLTVSIMKKIERGGLTLDTKLVIKKEHLDKKFGNLWQKGEGSMFSVRELIEISLKDSDNTAYNVLFDQLSVDEVLEVYNYLDIEVEEENSQALVSPKSYASIFRNLYLSSFLKKEDSNYVLDILTKTNFNDKIPAGVPASIPVAHKIGVFNIGDKSDTVFSDCGIVYLPKRPYLLCVFVEDGDEVAKKKISYLSNMIYQYMIIVGSNPKP